MPRGTLALFTFAVLAPLAGLLGCGAATRLEVVWDDCPSDPEKLEPGVCGCGTPEAACGPLLAALVHRYAFDGLGTTAHDTVGDADGLIVNAALLGSGELVLEGAMFDQYVDLPNGIISVLGNATFEAWVNWTAPLPSFWPRIFDFGVSSLGEDQRSHGESYLFLSPAEQFRTAFRTPETVNEILLDAPLSFPVNVSTHVAVTVDEAAQELRLYMNAELQGAVALAQPLSSVRDVNNWLGRSQFAADTGFGGSFREFRIYTAALSPTELASSYVLGENPEFLERL